VTEPALVELITDRRKYIETLMQVQDKQRDKVDFVLNRSQLMAWP